MLNIKEIIQASKGVLIQGNTDNLASGYKIDSRLIEKNDFYIPMLGEKVDGHIFIKSVAENGGIGSFVQKGVKINYNDIKSVNPEFALIEVDDTLTAMQDIARYNRNKHMDIESISITGSVGKTSTREMVASVFNTFMNTLVTEKNYNGHIGLPLMTLKIENQDIIILETGIDFIGEMDLLGGILKPSCAVVTNIGVSHVEKFGSQDIIYREKTNIANSLINKKKLLLNRDDPYLLKYRNDNVDIIYYGIQDANNVKYKENSIEYDTNIYNKEEHIVINTIGNHNILNSIVAIKLAEIYNIPTEYILKGISSYSNFPRRMEKIELKGITIIDDTYNASSSSAKSGIITLNELHAKRKIVVLADILELGDYSRTEHEKLGELFKSVDVDILLAYGENMKYLCETAKKYMNNVYWFKNKEETESKLKEIIKKEDIIYFKGSNAMKVNDIVEDIKKDFVE